MKRLGAMVAATDTIWSLAVAALAASIFYFGSPDPATAQNMLIDMKRGDVRRITLPVSKSVTVEITQPIGEILIADPNIADAQPVTGESIYIIGKGLGTTTINLFNLDKAPLGLLEIEVGADTAAIGRAIQHVAPQADVTVTTANGRVQLTGVVSDKATMDKVLTVVRQYGSGEIINALTLPDEQQVNLEVRILEATREAGRELGINWRYGPIGVNTSGEIIGTDGVPGTPGAGAIGNNTFQNNGIGLITDGANGQGPTGNNSFATFITNIISDAVTGINLDVIINALEAKRLVRTLAEPNLTTLSTQEARFLAGGEIPIRSVDAAGLTVITYKEFGVRLKFIPVVLGDDRIQMRLAPEVSELSGFTAANDPVFSTRNLESTIELRDGQSFAVAGLLQSTNRKVQNQLPWVGDIPVLGALFRSSSYQKNETELVVIVTPRLVRPNKPGQVVATPLDSTQTSNDVEFFLLGQLEVTKKMIKSYENGDGVVGPFGHMIDLEPAEMSYVKK